MKLKEYMRAARLSPEEGDKVEYMTMRDKMLCNAFVNSQRDIPAVSCVYNADVTDFVDVFNRLKAGCDYKLTFNTLMVKMLVEGLKSAPRLNAHFQYNHRSTSGKLIIKKHIDVSMAICLDDGSTFQMKLLHLEDKTLKEIAESAESAHRRIDNTDLEEVMFEVSRQRVIGELSRGRFVSPISQTIKASFGKGKVVNLSKSLKSDFQKIFGLKKLQPDSSVMMEEMNEGTVCITNWGSLYDNLDINITRIPVLYPQVFLLGVGKVKEEQYVYEDENGNLRIGTKKILPLSLNFDHKIGGAADLMPFVNKLDEIFRNPEIIKEW